MRSVGDELRLADLGPHTPGVLPYQHLLEARDAGWIDADDFEIPESAIQPASLDLHLDDHAYRMRCSFLPDNAVVEDKMQDYILERISLSGEGAVLETQRPYLVPLKERLQLPPFLRAKANPKSSTGRLDVFTRVITDHSYRFDEVKAGYKGNLYLEIVPLSFAVRVQEGLALNQLRLMIGRTTLSDDDLWAHHQQDPILFTGGKPADARRFAVSDGLFLSLDLRGDAKGRVGHKARENAPLIDMGKVDHYSADSYWEPATREPSGHRLVLYPERFYLLLSEEAVRIPPGLASEMTAYDPTSGELRTHYAGFFDPGFGYDPDDHLKGSRAALEVRAHDVPFMVEHRQRVCKLTFERMVCTPTKFYGRDIGSNYQGQVETLGKHFKRAQPKAVSTAPNLFSEMPT